MFLLKYNCKSKVESRDFVHFSDFSVFLLLHLSLMHSSSLATMEGDLWPTTTHEHSFITSTVQLLRFNSNVASYIRANLRLFLYIVSLTDSSLSTFCKSFPQEIPSSISDSNPIIPRSIEALSLLIGAGKDIYSESPSLLEVTPFVNRSKVSILEVHVCFYYYVLFV